MQTAITGRIEGIRVADVMDREPVAIPGELSVEQALDEYFLRYRWPWFPVVDAAHRFLGLLDRDRADEVPEVSRSTSLVSDLIERRGRRLPGPRRRPARLPARQPEPAPLRRPDGGRRRRPPLRSDHGRAGRASAPGRDLRRPGFLLRPLRGSSEEGTPDASGLSGRWRSMMRPKSVPDGQRAEGVAPVAGEAGGAEGVGDGLVAVADQQRGLQGDRHPLDDAAGARLDRLDVAGDLLAQGARRRRRGAARRRRPRAPRRRRPRPRPGS